jgi:hypothetical protein
MTVICAKCGARLNGGDNFCETCGSAVLDINAVINDLKKEKNSSEAVSKELTDLRDKFIKKNFEISRLESELDAKDQDIKNTQDLHRRIADGLKNENAAFKSARNAVIAVWLITLALAISIAWGLYSDMERRYRDLSTREALLRQEYDWLLENHTISMQWWPILITDIVVQNWDNKERVFLSKPGEDIYAGQMKYFNVKINFDSRVYGNFDFHIKLLDPDGGLFSAISSPSGYSFHKEINNIYRGRGQSEDLDGLPGTFLQGQWTVEVWLNGVRIAVKTITLK